MRPLKYWIGLNFAEVVLIVRKNLRMLPRHLLKSLEPRSMFARVEKQGRKK